MCGCCNLGLDAAKSKVVVIEREGKSNCNVRIVS